jgi:hypothetical protein
MVQIAKHGHVGDILLFPMPNNSAAWHNDFLASRVTA